MPGYHQPGDSAPARSKEERLGWVVALSGVTVVAMSGILGIATPMLLGRLGFDPAASSSPLITSLIDLLGVMVYFSIASRYLSI